MTDKPTDKRSIPTTLNQAVAAWCDVRERIFSCDGIPPPQLWTELGHAEQDLMVYARLLKEYS